ncbi:MAG TPA: AFG1/ZapE family ATPase [Solirubrobacteraceae bacterium]|jgi:DNA replication protein DnaC
MSADEEEIFLEQSPGAVASVRVEDRRASACALGMCDGSGFLIDEETNTARDCGCRPARIARNQAAQLEGRLPKLFKNVGFERAPVPDIERVAPDQVQLVRAYVRAIDANIDAGHGLWLTGDIGTGKTTLAMIVSKAAIEAGRSVAIYSLPRLLNVLREAMGSGEGLVPFLDRLAAVDLLHIDDLGVEKQTEWVLEQLYSIVNARYEAQRAIVATSNLMPDELADQLGARTVSRLIQICGDPHMLYGDDRRRQSTETLDADRQLREKIAERERQSSTAP